MKKECYLIQDVLLLYRENLCSEETKEVVEEHLAVCEECKVIKKPYLEAEGKVGYIEYEITPVHKEMVLS